MFVVRRHSPFGAVTGWWTLAARVLALLLVLGVAVPEAGLAADLPHHLSIRQTTLVMVSPADGAAQKADPGLATHVHCGCHVAAPVSDPDPILPAGRPRPRFARIAQAPSSIVPDLLPRPPRA
jgi:hypothetical protein